MSKFERGDRVRIIAGGNKGRTGIINYVISPNLRRDETPEHGYLVEVEGYGLPWYAESELEETKEKVIFT